MRPVRAALSGVLAGCASLAVAELVSAAVRPEAGPLVAVGGAAIDRTPAAVKDWAIRTFGADDKLVLRLGILAVLGLLAVVLGLVALRHRRAGSCGVLLLGLVGAAAATNRPDSTGPGDAVPSVAGALAGALVLHVLVGRAGVPSPGHDPAPSVDGPQAPEDPGPSAGRGGWDRRGFVAAAGAVAAASAGAGALGRALNGTRARDAVASRGRVLLPAPDSPAPAVPRGARLRVPGISPFVTANKDFYRVDTALVVPRVDAAAWRLRVHGRGVARPVTLSFDDLLRRGLIERDITLTCVSNEVGGPYVGNARWIGVPLADLLAEAGVRPPSAGGRADQLVARSVDGMTIGSPVEELMDGRDALLAVGMNGEPLPFEHGFPVRMVVPGLYGYVSACKWIEDIELTSFDAYDAYWVRRKWARRAPVRTQSRIDTPRPFARPEAGTVMVAGVAWAQHRGVSKVEVRVDDGPWQRAGLAAEDTRDTWRQWSFPWRATRGGHTLTVRATDGTGEVQTARRTRTVPDGASGRHSVVVTVE
ncbi:molybdopterin-dependent oxidoreductase [Streptomyces fructofermentans]|uniref:Oxidoreductase n=1 Tax=Streptomyces fructofermentans TaxID=152141 RepID=A0A918NKV7_9ACTN|nr:molybdopterin-dependent oxidoreductase [Streptomyces fructofermentans]GGX77280.1 oxidoreductase [Streptomyces fructofermentans]